MQDVKEQFIEFWKESGKERIFKIRGTSMRPLIRDSDNLGVIPVRHAEELRIGDIALFQRPTGMVAHRIVGKFRQDNITYLYEKGDRGVFPTTISGEMVIGKVVRIYRPGSTIDLTRSFWLFTNRSAGYYWHYLNAVFEFFYASKIKLFGAKKFPHLSSAWSKIHLFLSALPNWMFRRNNR
ncbi:MAG: hypothetical protein NTV89_03855 [Proteobacteria bacterium]|nr:hypothetical protein [Pseudomonadota bacterium]